MLRRPLVIGLAALAALVVLAGGGAYAYFFSGLRSAPAPLSLKSPAPAASAAATTATAGGLVGRWTATSGSLAGYRVKEQFVGQTSTHEAVARTSSVTGGLTVQQGSSGLQATGLRFAAQLAGLQSVDQVAGYNVTNRDRFVGRSLGVQQYPDAVFEAATLTLPATVAGGQTATVSVPGQLTVHGVTRPVTATVQIRMTGGQVQAAGSTAFDMTQFGVTPPQVPFTQAEPHVTIDFQLVLVKSV
jgi:polyisoprenoid-binding protein YceI